MRSVIDSWGIAPLHMSMFGSAARGGGDTQSDIDPFIIRSGAVEEEDSQWRGQLRRRSPWTKRCTTPSFVHAVRYTFSRTNRGNMPPTIQNEAMPGRIYNLLAEVALDQHGYVTTRDAEGLGIDPHRLPEMARRGTIERAERGVYRFPTVATTGLEQYMEATLWPEGRGVLSHETALDLHDLCDVNPARIHITVPAGYRIRRRVPDLYVIHRRDLDREDLTRHEGIAIVTPRRAILDGIEAHARPDLLHQALDTARKRGLVRGAEAKELGRLLERRPPKQERGDGGRAQ